MKKLITLLNGDNVTNILIVYVGFEKKKRCKNILSTTKLSLSRY